MFITLKKIRLIFLVTLGSHTLNASSLGFHFTQIDSLINEKNVNQSETQLDLLILYQEALKEERKDSIQVFKNLALLNADLVQPEDAYKYTVKYINHTLDFSILENPAYESIKNTAEYDKLNDKYNVKIDFFTFLFFYTALIGFFFALVINFLKNVKYSTKIFISLFVGINALFILEFVFFISNFKFRFPHTYLMTASMALWFGPLLFFYFKSLSENFRFQTKDLLHFIPNLLLVVYLLPMYSLDPSDKIRVMLHLDPSFYKSRYVIFILKMISLSVYAIMIGRLNYENKIWGDKSQKSLLVVNNWKRNVYRIFVSYVIVYLLYGLSSSGLLGLSLSFLTYLMVGIMGVMVFYISYMSYVQPSLFTNNLKHGGNIFISKYQKSGLTEALSIELKENMINLFQEEKIFKQSNLNLEILSEKIGTTRHNTSQIINEHFDMNFFELVNKFRIEEAIEIFKNDTNHNLNIIDVAFEVGYNNKATFNKAFKKETNLTPTEFISLKQSHKSRVIT